MCDDDNTGLPAPDPEVARIVENADETDTIYIDYEEDEND
jgi:hypothetical protein